MERMTEADPTMLLLSLQREMAKMKRKTEETAQKNEQELGEGGPSVIPVESSVIKSFEESKSQCLMEG